VKDMEAGKRRAEPGKPPKKGGRVQSNYVRKKTADRKMVRRGGKEIGEKVQFCWVDAWRQGEGGRTDRSEKEKGYQEKNLGRGKGRKKSPCPKEERYSRKRGGRQATLQKLRRGGGARIGRWTVVP